MLLAFGIPVFPKALPFIIISIVLTWLLEGNFELKVSNIFAETKRAKALMFMVIYLLYILGMIYSSNFAYGYFDLEVKMSLIIFPVLLATFPRALLERKVAYKVLWAFVYGMIVSMLFCYSQAIYHYISSGSLLSFYYARLSPLIHPSYLAMYAGFAFAVVMYFILEGMITGLRKVFAFILLGFFVLFIVMLSSKAGVIGIVMLISLFAMYMVFVRRKFIPGILTGSVYIVLFLVLFQLLPKSAERFRQSRDTLESSETIQSEQFSSTRDRLLIWWHSFEITNEHFLIGVGTGDVKDYLLSKYEEKGMEHAREQSLNAHNQYLQTMIALGIIGLIVLLLNFILPALESIDNKDYLYLFFLILLAFNFLFESMLETQAGVVFYAFFNTYLFLVKKDPASSEAGS